MKLIRTLSACLRDLGYFFIVLFLYLFITALASMDIFRNKMVFNGVHSRNNFDSWGWAMITSFQVRATKTGSALCVAHC